MAAAPGTGPGPPPPGNKSREAGWLARVENGFEWFLSLARVLVLVPVITLVVSAAGAFAYGAAVFIDSLPGTIEKPVPVGSKLGLFLIEIDLFLIGATLIIAAFGFYELFISKIDPGERRFALPRWLEMRDLNDLKARVISMLILVAGVSFVEVVLNFHNGLDTLYLGASVALVIAALTVFLRFGSQDHRDR